MVRIHKIDRLAWLRAEDLAFEQVKKIKSQLSIYHEDPNYDKAIEFKLYEDDAMKNLLGVPRFYALQKFDTNEMIDETMLEHISYPMFHGKLRPHQDRVIEPVISGIEKHKFGGILCAACGTGKTVTALYILSCLSMRTLVLLHKKDLMDQWRDEAHRFYRMTNTGWVKQNRQEFEDRPITFASYQTVRSRQAELEAKGFFKYFSVVLVDEVHRLSAQTYAETIKLFSPRLQLGLTATPRRRDGLEDVFFWHTGPIIGRMDAKRETGEYIQVKWNAPYTRKLGTNVARGITLIGRDVNRNMKIAEEIVNAYNAGRKVIAMSDRLDQVDIIFKAVRKRLMETGELVSVDKYIGSMKGKQLKEAKNAKIIIGSYGMFSEGTDIPDADTLFLITPRGDVEQIVGRIQRVHEDKKPLIIYDIVDNGMPILFGMGRKRAKIFEKLGFKKMKG